MHSVVDVYCPSHFKQKYLCSAPAIIPKCTAIRRLPTYRGWLQWFFRSEIDRKVIWCRNKEDFIPSKEERGAIHVHNQKWDSLQSGYGIDIFRTEQITPTISCKQYSMKEMAVPLFTADGMISTSFVRKHCNVVDTAIDNLDELIAKYPDAIQACITREKIHCNWTYKTTGKHAGILVESTLKFDDLVSDPEDIEEVAKFMRDMREVLIAMGMGEGTEYLLNGPLGDGVQVMYGRYKGGCLKAHPDAGFQHWVIVIPLRNCPQNKKSIVNEPVGAGKRISFAMNGNKEYCSKASIPNFVGQVYGFGGWFTDWAVHGVQGQAGNESIVMIIRVRRKKLLARSFG